MLGILRVHRSRMSSLRDAITSLYGYTCTSTSSRLSSSSPTVRPSHPPWQFGHCARLRTVLTRPARPHRDPNPKRKTPSTTTSPACTPTSSVRERGSKVKPTFISPYRIEYRISIPDVLPFASHHRIYQSNTPDSMPFLQMGWRIVRDGRGGKVGWRWRGDGGDVVGIWHGEGWHGFVMYLYITTVCTK